MKKVFGSIQAESGHGSFEKRKDGGPISRRIGRPPNGSLRMEKAFSRNRATNF